MSKVSARACVVHARVQLTVLWSGTLDSAPAVAEKLDQGLEMKDLGDLKEAAVHLGLNPATWGHMSRELPKEAERLADLWRAVSGCEGVRRSGSRILCTTGPGGVDLGSCQLQVHALTCRPTSDSWQICEVIEDPKGATHKKVRLCLRELHHDSCA